jgi:hypothetical protein
VAVCSADGGEPQIFGRQRCRPNSADAVATASGAIVLAFNNASALPLNVALSTTAAAPGHAARRRTDGDDILPAIIATDDSTPT